MGKDLRKFGGKQFTHLGYRYTKAVAEKDANHKRHKGWCIRIVKRKVGKRTRYVLYERWGRTTNVRLER